MFRRSVFKTGFTAIRQYQLFRDRLKKNEKNKYNGYWNLKLEKL